MNVMIVMLILSALAVLGTMLAGIYVLTRKGMENRKLSNKLMQARVILQGMALALLLVLLIAF